MKKISIITVCYNSAEFLETAIKSVVDQVYSNIEYIVVDGASTDKTVSIIKKYEKHITKWVSEPDKGIYDAMNKGIKMAHGDVIGFLNSDDFYSSNNSVNMAMNVFNNNNTDCVFADINYVNQLLPNKIVRRWVSGVYKKGSFMFGWHPAHPTFWVNKYIYEKYGDFNLSFSLAADFEIMLRFLEKNNISNVYINKPLIHMRLGGATSSSFKNIVKQNLECYRAFSTNGLKVSVFYMFFRLIPKIKEFLR